MARVGRKAWRSGRLFPCIAAAALALGLEAGTVAAPRTLNVPRDFATIKAAVAASRDGDTVLVGKGTYVEDGIVVDKRIRLLSEEPYGAVIYGSVTRQTAIFIVRAEAEIAGFMLKNGFTGIRQRDSPDVEWRGRDLIVLNMEGSGIEVNDVERSVGAARLTNIIVGNCQNGIVTNDARGIDLHDSLIVRCTHALGASNHLFFTADRLALWDCVLLADEAGRPIPPATKQVRLGRSVAIIPAPMRNPGSKSFPSALPALPFPDGPDPGGPKGIAAALRRAVAVNLYGAILLDKGDPAAALEHFQTAAALARRLEVEEIFWEAEFGRGRALEKLGRPETAAEQYRIAADSVDRIARTLLFPSVTGGFFLDKAALFAAGLDLLVRLDRADPAKSYGREAFLWAERFRASLDPDRRETPAEAPVPASEPPLRKRASEILAAVSRSQLRLQEDTLTADARRLLLEDLARLEDEYRILIMPARRADPDRTKALPPPPTRLEEIRGALPAGAGLLEYALGPDRSYLFFVSGDDYVLAPLPPAGEIEAAVRAYTDFLTISDEREFHGFRAARRLREMLITPAGPSLEKVRNLIVVPDGSLYHLPFEALAGGRESDEAASRRFLVEDLAVSYLPSAAALIRGAERARERGDAAGFLGVAAGRGAISGYPGPNLTMPLAPLRNAAGETRAAARFFAGERVDLLLGRNAREDRLKALNLGLYGVLHFASHGVIDEDHAWRSALILEASGGEDGYLQPMDIRQFELNAELVVLSACRTAAGRLESGGGVQALSRPFIAAGAGAVVSSLWRVNDFSTGLFMRRFYERLAGGASIAEALRGAKTDLLRTKRSHPFHWAGFILTGKGDAPLACFGEARGAGRS